MVYNLPLHLKPLTKKYPSLEAVGEVFMPSNLESFTCSDEEPLLQEVYKLLEQWPIEEGSNWFYNRWLYRPQSRTKALMPYESFKRMSRLSPSNFSTAGWWLEKAIMSPPLAFHPMISAEIYTHSIYKGVFDLILDCSYLYFLFREAPGFDVYLATHLDKEFKQNPKSTKGLKLLKRMFSDIEEIILKAAEHDAQVAR